MTLLPRGGGDGRVKVENCEHIDANVVWDECILMRELDPGLSPQEI